MAIDWTSVANVVMWLKQRASNLVIYQNSIAVNVIFLKIWIRQLVNGVRTKDQMSTQLVVGFVSTTQAIVTSYPLGSLALKW